MNYLVRFFLKHKWLYSILIVLLMISCSFLGLVLDIEKTIDTATEEMKEKSDNLSCQMFMSEALSDHTFYSYMEDNSDTFYDIQSLLYELETNEQFQFIIGSDQFLEVTKPEMPDIFLYGYEDGCAEDAKETTSDGVLYATKALQVSDEFFEVYSINVTEGSKFSEYDYTYHGNEEIPVILGAAYQEYFEVGDIIEGMYLLEKFSFKIIGFIEDTSFFYRWNSTEMTSCERYILMPVFRGLPNDDFGKRALLQYLTAYIVSDESYAVVSGMIQDLLRENNIEETEINLADPSASGEKVTLSQKYSAMTGAVSGYFTIIVGIMVGCIGFILTAVLINLIQEENYNFGIYIMSGMSRRRLAGVLFLFDFALVGGGDILTLCILAFNRVSLRSIAIVQSVLAFVLFVSFFGCWIKLCKMDVAELIGGKE